MTKKCIACDIYCLFAQGRNKKYNRVIIIVCLINMNLNQQIYTSQHELLSLFSPLKPGLSLNKNSMSTTLILRIVANAMIIVD